MKKIAVKQAPLPAGRQGHPPPTPTFFVLAEIGQNTEDESLPVPPEWDKVCHTVANALMELLTDDVDIVPRLAGKEDQCVVLATESQGFPADTPIVAHGKLTGLLKPLLTTVLSGEPGTVARGPLLSDAEDLRHGQLIGTMLIVEGLEFAQEFCNRVKKGEIKLPMTGEATPDKGPTEVQEAKIREIIGQIAHAAPESYDAKRRSFTHISDTVREELAKALEPALNAEAKMRPHGTYEEKKELAKWINAELRRFGLALRAPGITEPCILVAHPGNHPLLGRFQLDFSDANGVRHRTVHSVTLPHLELMLDNMVRVPYAQRTNRSR